MTEMAAVKQRMGRMSEWRCEYCGSCVIGPRCSQCGASRSEVEQPEEGPLDLGDLAKCVAVVAAILMLCLLLVVSFPRESVPTRGMRATEHIPLWQSGDDDLVMSGTLRVSDSLMITGTLK